MALIRPRLAVALALLVLVPVGLLGWLALRSASGEQARLRQSFEEVAKDRLGALKRAIDDTVAAEARALSAVLAEPAVDDTAAWRAIPAANPLVSAVFAVDERGSLIHPPRDGASNDEEAFLARAAAALKNAARWPATGGEHGAASTDGWQVFYHGEGPRFLYWQQRSEGIVGAEVPATALLARVVAKLPADRSDEAEAGWRIVWRDAGERLIAQWGRWGGEELPSDAHPVATVAPAPPFAGWPLAVHGDDVTAAGTAAWRRQLFTALGLVAALLAALAVWLYRESTRDLRTAAQRITFVNLVSHELKTPLTNISLYAELAAARLGAEDGRARECLDVVVAESGRLGRLITNVLTFSRHQRGALTPRTVTLDLADAAAEALRTAEPGLAEKGIRCDTAAASPVAVKADPDMLQQILGNLLSNVEKYAAAGGAVTVRTEAADTAGRVSVEDRGPGIPSALRERVFEPFFRVSDRLTDGVAGTGIGLGLARDLARAMGGDVTLECPPHGGCRFILTLPLA